ncbi:hypothetical protein PFISCL1PPCAC_7392 [Pristionchus fissidentatus]|uniref:Pepsin inhibitor-3-like repeated domain-containing protein n=1 Tax=Pristionchus fissidentatus TaxID=1538716 RepID=A0AAV5VDX3_9BILA|nr:hypothetical protein PFISCL1PPCAC_7392 [Pristionchus fissidentatus]
MTQSQMLRLALLLLPIALAADVGPTESISTTVTREKGCTIESDKVIENGVERKLNEAEKQQLAEYAIALDEYFKHAFHPKSLTQPKGKLPKFPEICKSDKVVSEHHVVAFEGCSITDDQLYVDGKFVRKLSDEEKKQIKDFKDGVETFKSQIDDFLKEQMVVSISGGKVTRKQPQPPSPPKICPSTSNKTVGKKISNKESLTETEDKIKN